jgi:hypothetical protein
MSKLRIETTADDRESWRSSSVVAYTFEYVDGWLQIGEEWDDMDETWSSGLIIDIPPRVWRQAVQWMAEQAPPA